MNDDVAVPAPIGRRAFLVASASGFAGYCFGRPQPCHASTDQGPATERGKARSTILFFLCGGASHIDTWDMKPSAPEEYRGPFKPIATTAPGVRLCEHLPLLARQSHHLAVVNSVGATVNTNDHHAGYYYNLTGHVPDATFLSLGNNRTPMSDDWPYMGCVVASRRPTGSDLPNAITLPYMPSRAPYTRPGQFAARLGVEHDPLYLEGSNEQPLKFRAPALALAGDVTPQRLLDRQALLRQLDQARRKLEHDAATEVWSRQCNRALGLLASSQTSTALDVSREPATLRQRYGETVNGMSLLLARRLVEAGVPFITVFWMGNDTIARKCRSGGGWDTHGNNFRCLADDLLPEFDRGFSALVEDLDERGLLDQTLLLVTSEMGRRPKIGDRRSGGVAGAGRDHWTHCMSVLLAGGGIRGGCTYGESDKYAEYPARKRVTPADITKTVYAAMGIDNLEAFDKQGRPYNLLAEGQPIAELL